MGKVCLQRVPAKRPRCKRGDTSYSLISRHSTLFLSLLARRINSHDVITWKGEMEWDASDIAQVYGKRIRWKGNDGWVSLSATSIVAYFSTEATIPIFLFFFYLTFFVTIIAVDNGRILSFAMLVEKILFYNTDARKIITVTRPNVIVCRIVYLAPCLMTAIVIFSGN